MRVAILALGSRGDILPYAALGKGLRAAGHRVCLITTENFAPMVAAHGLDFYPLAGDAQAVVQRAGASMPALIRSFRDLAQGLARHLEQLAPTLRETDVLLNQLPGGLYGYDLAERLDLTMLLVAVIPLTRTSAFPMMGWPTLFSPLPGYNRLSYLVAEQMAWQLFRRPINRWRQQALGLPPSPWSGYLHQLYRRQVPVLNGFSAHVVPRPPDWGQQVHVTGYWFLDDETWQPSQELERFVETDPRPVFLGFGSMPIRHPQRTTERVLRVLEQSGLRAVLHAGWGDLGERTVSDSAFKIDYAPYGWLFPRMAAVVHHGGSGTTGFGVWAGVPSLVVPFVFDQFYWGRRLAALGVAPEPIPFRRLSARRLADALDLAVNDPDMRRRAAALGAKVQAEDGIANAVEVIERAAQ